MLQVEARNAQTPIERKPSGSARPAKMGPEFTQIHSMVKGQGLHTVCQEAGCPNIFECWEDREATFLIGGDTCTRRCDFCDIAAGRPQPLDLDEPRRSPSRCARWACATPPSPVSPVTTSPTRRRALRRDDPPDPRAEPQHRRRDPPVTSAPSPSSSGRSSTRAPRCFAHNLETVPIFKRIRPAFTYDKSLRHHDGPRRRPRHQVNLILGMGEEDHEIEEAIRDLHDAGCDILTITQYLRPPPSTTRSTAG